MRSVYFLSVILFSIHFTSKGQSYYSPNLTSRIYTDLELALQDKEVVYRLDLSYQKLTQIPSQIYEFENLEYLKLDGNQIKNPQFRFNQLSQLKYLSLKENGMRSFRIKDKCLEMLEELYLDKNELLIFPEIENEMIQLTTLSLRQNFITELPAEDLSLTQLRLLYLDANPLKNAELAFTYSSNLERLSLYETNLKSIPDGRYFPRLTKLVLSGNQLDLNDLHQSKFPKVEYLDISYNAVSHVQQLEGLTTLKSLKYLVAEDMGIRELPQNMNELKRLREISLLRNQLQALPDSFYQLKLKLINLEYNQFTEEKKDEIKARFKGATIHM